jgi:hypothetical protein
MGPRHPHYFSCISVLVAFLAACGSESDATAIINPMLERWCDAHPCGWDVEGQVKLVGTWHPDDFASELVSDHAELSQFRAELSNTQATCFAFSLMAELPASATAYLELDFLDDGEPEFHERIPASDWQVRTFTIATPTWYEGVRFIIRKDGPGHVVVAELNVDELVGCGLPPLALMNRPAGANCAANEECTSGSCPKLELSAGGTCD